MAIGVNGYRTKKKTLLERLVQKNGTTDSKIIKKYTKEFEIEEKIKHRIFIVKKKSFFCDKQKEENFSTKVEKYFVV